MAHHRYPREHAEHGAESCGPLHGVEVVGCPVGATAGRGPDQGAGGGLVEVPAGGLFGAVVVVAERRETALMY